MRCIVAIVALLAAATLAHSQGGWYPPIIPSDTADAWKACVLSTVDRYSKSPESAETVVSVAMMACKEDWRRMYAIVTHATGGDGREHTRMKMFQDAVNDEALLRVMGTRIGNPPTK